MSSLKLDTVEPKKPAAKSKFDLLPNIPMRCSNATELASKLGFKHDLIHSSIIKLGLRMNRGLIEGSLESCLFLMSAVRDVVKDFRLPKGGVISRDLSDRLNIQVEFVNKMRPMTISMKNSIDKVQSDISDVSAALSEFEARKMLVESIEKYINEEISCALQAITEYGSSKVSNGDVVLIYGHSIEVQHILYAAFADGKEFDVIVVDSSPHNSGMKLVQFLKELDRDKMDFRTYDRRSVDGSSFSRGGSRDSESSDGRRKKNRINISYIHINSIVHIMNDVSRIILGVDAIFANGYVMARAGCAQLAMIAHKHNVPIIVCCETFGFADTVPTDAFVVNEIGERLKCLTMSEFYHFSCQVWNRIITRTIPN